MDDKLVQNGLLILNNESEEFDLLLSIYDKARLNMLEQLNLIKDYLKEIYDYDVINHIVTRIKTKNSIINKMKKKHLELNYKNLIDNINDVAGIRIVCSFKNDIYKVRNIISSMENIKIIKEKDYIKKPKSSGYSGYHIILQNFVKIDNEEVPIKVEIQIRSLGMDFWATTEHRMKYKPKYKLNAKDSKKLQIYAKIINIIDTKIMKIYQKQLNN